jgi:DNA-binding XRE family transcriptional regulator
LRCLSVASASKPPNPRKSPKNLKHGAIRSKAGGLELGRYQAQVALILGVTESTVTNWEKHRTNPTLHLFPKIIEFLGYDPMPTETKTLGDMLLRYRKSRGVTQKELAMKIEIDLDSYLTWGYIGKPLDDPKCQ